MSDHFTPMFQKPGTNAMWVLKRQDNNGDFFEIESFEVYYLARKRLREYEEEDDSQIYSIEKI